MNEFDISKVQINSSNPCLIVFLVDQSGSMELTYGGNNTIKKKEHLANSINQTIYEIGLRSISGGGDLKNRFEIAVIGYGRDNDVYSAFEGNLSGRWVVSIKELFDNPINYVNDIPIWISPNAYSATPMVKAFHNVHALTQDWINFKNANVNHIDCHPPIIINVTDGEPTDSDGSFRDLFEIADEIKNLGTNFGKSLIFNCHISEIASDPIIFPDNDPKLDLYSSVMFDLSCSLTPKMVDIAVARGYNINDNSKGFIYNAGTRELVDFLNIGSSPA